VFNIHPGLRVDIITISDDVNYDLGTRERIRERLSKLTASLTDHSDRARVHFSYGTRKETSALLRQALSPQSNSNDAVLDAAQEDLTRLQELFAQAQSRLAKMQARLNTSARPPKPL
jgi:hypothetical protein